MNRKKKQAKPDIEKETDYYDLKKDAINALAEADESNSPEVSKEELKKYRSASGIHLPGWLTAYLIKAWFAGAVCFFFIWGLGIYMADVYDTLLVTGIGMGIVTDIITNNALRFMEPTRGENDKYIMVTMRGYISFILNMLYSCFVLFFVYTLYIVINGILGGVTGQPDKVYLGVEPILFGLFYLGFDLLFIEIKHFLTGVIKKTGKPVSDK